ncbi:MAG: ribosome biogenesis GTPase YlqF [Betaproteobacteria bacterium]|nr:ribosome biogenesis GTPase YlqF [Betaproteobacteria bacterium]NBY04650.1 ribosome biogenesis GTPase YlqF [Betaproteobacteria bacterium]
MAIQWFPGHMHLTRKAIGERIKDIDVVIEMLDARLPGSSANPMLGELIQGKPTLKVLSKQDLADADRTQDWLRHYNAQPGVRALALDTSMASPAKALIQACQTLAPMRGGMVKPMRVLMCGIPNVGKSTLINTLKGQRAAKTGDEAGVTKVEQRISLADDFYIYDTPGVLWPRIIVAQSGYNLAASGAVGVNAFDEQEVALELLQYLLNHYPQNLALRYKVPAASLHSDAEWLQAIARQRGAVQSGGRLNTAKAADLVIHDFRSGALGRVTLETPTEFAQWLKLGQLADAQRQQKPKRSAKSKTS